MKQAIFVSWDKSTITVPYSRNKFGKFTRVEVNRSAKVSIRRYCVFRGCKDLRAEAYHA